MQGTAAVFTSLTMMTVAFSCESLLNCHVLLRNLDEKLPYVKTALNSCNLKVCHAFGVPELRNKLYSDTSANE